MASPGEMQMVIHAVRGDCNLFELVDADVIKQSAGTSLEDSDVLLRHSLHLLFQQTIKHIRSLEPQILGNLQFIQAASPPWDIPRERRHRFLARSPLSIR
jgi:hypothetical protein